MKLKPSFKKFIKNKGFWLAESFCFKIVTQKLATTEEAYFDAEGFFKISRTVSWAFLLTFGLGSTNINVIFLRKACVDESAQVASSCAQSAIQRHSSA